MKRFMMHTCQILILLPLLFCTHGIALAASCANGPVWLGGAEYAQSIQVAYDSIAADATFQLEGRSYLGTPFSESVLLSGKNHSVRLLGGYACDYGTRDDVTVINGTLKVRSGTLRVSNIRISSAPRAALTIQSTTPGSGVPLSIRINGAVVAMTVTPQGRVVAQGDVVTLTAPGSAPNGNLFSAWSGCDVAGSGGTLCSVTMSTDRVVTATYLPPTPPAPLITAVQPSTGSAGTSVTLTGSGFSGASSVAFNGTAAAFSADSDTQITTSVPAGATSGSITIITPGGSATSPTPFTITVRPPSLWESRGVGAGGALYVPTINPANPAEYYLSCDMSEVFHTTDFGDSYSELNADQIQGGTTRQSASPATPIPCTASVTLTATTPCSPRAVTAARPGTSWPEILCLMRTNTAFGPTARAPSG